MRDMHNICKHLQSTSIAMVPKSLRPPVSMCLTVSCVVQCVLAVSHMILVGGCRLCFRCFVLSEMDAVRFRSICTGFAINIVLKSYVRF